MPVKQRFFIFIMSHRIFITALFLAITLFLGWFAAHSYSR